jgi:thermostable 8-oxoguanine DNA glycosylase
MPSIEPTKITNYERTEAELESFLLFCVIVAGKNSDWAAGKIEGMFRGCAEDHTPLDFINNCGVGLRNYLVANKVGQYNRIERCFSQLAELKLSLGSIRKMTLDDLLNVFGIGPKTARFFLLHSRKNIKVAVLDVHILKWLGTIFENAPTSTPTSKKSYEYWEKAFLSMAETNFPNLTIADLDLYLWMKFSGRLEGEDLIGQKAYKPELP